MRQGWKTCKFADVFDLQMGKTPSRDNPTYWGDDNMWVSIADMNEQKYMSATKEGLPLSQTCIFVHSYLQWIPTCCHHPNK